MGVWKREPQVDPAVIQAIQARIDADPVVQRMRNGEGWTRVGGGRVSDPDQLAKYIAQRYQMPSGYNVSQSGEVVYGNETGWLRKAVTAAAPILGVQAVGMVAGASPFAAAPTAATGSTLGPATAIPGLHAAVPGAVAPAISVAPTMAGTLGTATAIPGVHAATAPALTSASVTPGGASTAIASTGLVGKIRKALTTGEGVEALAPLIPMLFQMVNGNSGNGGGGMSRGALEGDITNANAIAKRRLEQVSPIYDTMVNQAFGTSPTHYRSSTAPDGYKPNEAPAGPYAYQAPRFGGA